MLKFAIDLEKVGHQCGKVYRQIIALLIRIVKLINSYFIQPTIIMSSTDDEVMICAIRAYFDLDLTFVYL